MSGWTLFLLGGAACGYVAAIWQVGVIVAEWRECRRKAPVKKRRSVVVSPAVIDEEGADLTTALDRLQRAVDGA